MPVIKPIRKAIARFFKAQARTIQKRQSMVRADRDAEFARAGFYEAAAKRSRLATVGDDSQARKLNKRAETAEKRAMRKERKAKSLQRAIDKRFNLARKIGESKPLRDKPPK